MPVWLKTIAALAIVLGSFVGLFWVKGVKAGVPWICKLIGRPDLINPDIYGPMYVLGEDGKFHFRDDDDEEDDEEEVSKY